MPRKRQITSGTVFNDLTYLQDAGAIRKPCGVSTTVGVFKCICGKIKTLQINPVVNGHTKSCGCLASKIISDRNYKHGLSKNIMYRRWSYMMTRCYNPKSINYKDYGGRGIEVCERWHEFINFYNDLGEPPFEKASLDRIDNDGHYEPSNVTWASQKEQTRNQRVRKNSRTGIRGVTLVKNTYIARKCVDGKIFNLGSFKTIIEAKEAVDNFEKNLKLTSSNSL